MLKIMQVHFEHNVSVVGWYARPRTVSQSQTVNYLIPCPVGKWWSKGAMISNHRVWWTVLNFPWCYSSFVDKLPSCFNLLFLYHVYNNFSTYKFALSRNNGHSLTITGKVEHKFSRNWCNFEHIGIEWWVKNEHNPPNPTPDPTSCCCHWRGELW